jgi:hypothetical protein
MGSRRSKEGEQSGKDFMLDTGDTGAGYSHFLSAKSEMERGSEMART